MEKNGRQVLSSRPVLGRRSVLVSWSVLSSRPAQAVASTR